MFYVIKKKKKKDEIECQYAIISFDLLMHIPILPNILQLVETNHRFTSYEIQFIHIEPSHNVTASFANAHKIL